MTKAWHRKQKGHVLTEYGFILAMVAVVSVAAMSLFGQDLTRLLTGTVRNGLNSNPAQDLTGMRFGTPANYHASARPVSNPFQPEAALPAGNTASAEAAVIQAGPARSPESSTNATSVDGTIFSNLATARELDRLADEARGGPAESIIRRLADWEYIMGVVEGVKYQVNGLRPHDLGMGGDRSFYERNGSDADVNHARQKMRQILVQGEGMPAVRNSPVFQRARQLVNDSIHLSYQLVPDGPAHPPVVNGTPNQALFELVPKAKFRQVGLQALQNHSSPQPIHQTLQNGRDTETLEHRRQ